MFSAYRSVAPSPTARALACECRTPTSPLSPPCWIAYVGTLDQSADETGRAHQALFDSFVKGTRLAHEVLSVRRVGPASAHVVTHGATAKGSKPAELNKVRTYSLVRTGSGWKVAAFQNTKHRPLLEAARFKFQPASKPAA
ncbi:DUF4440 domain-containing protein [Amycolatopsis rubida]|uniref:SgcJ/EcaC family oxidoreductase n=1 Tax=Amycolatopsis rubida TaxID=112413 RepID=A0A1I5E7N2_9PSEU|nr:DUF4440 domain-containing protein [Amycolatopsis rubida]SFO07482.1 conserved hypothetical protein [Amycolatopsis rubida]